MQELERRSKIAGTAAGALATLLLGCAPGGAQPTSSGSTADSSSSGSTSAGPGSTSLAPTTGLDTSGSTSTTGAPPPDMPGPDTGQTGDPPPPPPPCGYPSETNYNPFGDPWATKRPANPFIQVALTPGCNRSGTKAMAAPDCIDPAELEFLAKSNAPVLFEECAILGNAWAARYDAFTAGLAAVNPAMPFVGYYAAHLADVNQIGGSLANEPNYPPNAFHIVRADNGAFLAAPNGTEILDITDPGYRAYVTDRIKTFMDAHGLGGVFIDVVSPTIGEAVATAKKELVEAGLPTDDASVQAKYAAMIPQPIRDNWGGAWLDLMRDLKAAVAPRLVFANTGMTLDGAFMTAIVSNDPPRADGVMIEDPIGPVGVDIQASGRMQAMNAVLDGALPLGKRTLIVVNTNVNGTTFQTTDAQKERALAWYYLTAFLTIFRGNATMLYYTPDVDSPQFNTETYFREWDLAIGDPTSNPAAEVPGMGLLYSRTFSGPHGNSVMYWNNHATNVYKVSLPEALYDAWTCTGPFVEVTIPPSFGAIFGPKPMIAEVLGPTCP